MTSSEVTKSKPIELKFGWVMATISIYRCVKIKSNWISFKARRKILVNSFPPSDQLLAPAGAIFCCYKSVTLVTHCAALLQTTGPIISHPHSTPPNNHDEPSELYIKLVLATRSGST